MKVRKNNAIAFGITLVPGNRTGNSNTNPEKRRSAVRRKSIVPRKIEPMFPHEFDCPRTKMPPPGKPFTPDLFITEPVPLPHFPPPRKMFPKEERVWKEQERFRSRTASHPASGKSSSTAGAVAWEFFKVVFAGVFLAFKYLFIAVAVIITIGCMICAGRQPTGLR